jgi:antirestriction protein ArdC
MPKTQTQRPRMTAQEREAMQLEALGRARNCRSAGNMIAVITEFVDRGIPASEITPGENVLTFNAWKALGRHVKRGEKGVKVCTMRPVTDDSGEIAGRAFTSAYVFHVSQTAEIVK